ncbi:MAG: GH92 family glycosyl hydrolase [Ignavibacteriaceae bacterium]
MKQIMTFFVLFFLQLSINAQTADNLVDYINPFIGVLDSVSNCVIGPQLPFSSINPSPQTPGGAHDGYAPDQHIRGFGQLQVSGTGWGKYGQILVSPQIGLSTGEADHDSPKSDEIAKAYYYSVNLIRYNIKTELTPAEHSAIYRFTFPESDSADIIIDVTHNIPMDIAPYIGGTFSEGVVSIDSLEKNKITGFGKYSGGFGNGDYYVFFCAEFSKIPAAFGTWHNKKILNESTQSRLINEDDRIGAFVNYSTLQSETICMKIGVSLKSIKQAEYWLAREIPGWDFDKVKNNAINKWNENLGKIKIEGADDYSKTLFYTAMYHAMLMPRDRTNDIMGYPDNAIIWDDEYAVWDTWRTAFPLWLIIKPQVVRDNINSFIERLKINGVTKDAFIAGIDMFAEQGGNNVDNVIADAYVKGLTGINWEDAYKVVKHDADFERLGFQGMKKNNNIDSVMAQYKSQGWIPAGIMSCSQTLEYAYNDYCASEIAEGLGKTDDYKNYLDRSKKWIALWDPEQQSDGFSGFIVPKSKDGNFIKIDPEKNWGSWHRYFYEASSWTYSYFVPHQFPKLVKLMGGKDEFVKRLNYGFKNGLVDYGNEPAFLAVQAYHYAGRPDLTGYWKTKLMNEKFTDRGYPGNDDSGAMSSWYIFSSIGFFPNAGQNLYYINGTKFDKTIITLENNKQIVIEGENVSRDNIYVQSCRINGKEWNKSWFTQDDIKNGAVIKIKMGPGPSKTWGKNWDE